MFNRNKLAGHINYVRDHEVVPHPWNKAYYLSKDISARTLTASANSCLHRGYQLVDQRQKLDNGKLLVCDFHNWAYTGDGGLIATPGFDKPICNRSLPKARLIDVNGFFFEDESVAKLDSLHDFFQVPNIRALWLDDFSFRYETKTEYAVSWQIFMEIYLDGYHVKPYHPGLGSYLKCDEMEWFFGSEYSLQVNEICDPGTDFSGSPKWGTFYNEVQRVGWDQKWGAMFGTIYPGLMIEFYPHIFVISQIIPSDKGVTNYVQVYTDEQADSIFRNAFAEAYDETAVEDGALQDRLEAGRAGNWYDLEMLPAHSKLEAGLEHMNNWIMRNK